MLYATVKDNPYLNVKIYYKVYQANDIDSISYSQSITDKLPTLESNSADNYVSINIENGMSNYIIFGIYSETDEVISVSSVSATFVELFSQSFPDVNRRSFYIEKNKKNELDKRFKVSSENSKYVISLYTPDKPIEFTNSIESISNISIDKNTNYYIILNEQTEIKKMQISTTQQDSDNFVMSSISPLYNKHNFIEIKSGLSIIKTLNTPFSLTTYLIMPKNFTKISISITTDTVEDPEHELSIQLILVYESSMKYNIVEDKRNGNYFSMFTFDKETKSFKYELFNEIEKYDYIMILINTIIGIKTYDISSFNVNTVISKEIEEATINESYFRSSVGREKKTFKVSSTCDECTWFKIEIENQFRNNTELDKFSDFSYELALEEPKYKNLSTGIKNIEESESNGVRRLIFQIEQSAASKSLYYTIYNNDIHGLPIPDDYTLNYYVQFSNAKTKEELSPLVFDNQLTIYREQLSVKLTFKEVFNDTNINKSKYYIYGMKKSDYSIEGVKSVFPDDLESEFVKSIDGKNDGSVQNVLFELDFDMNFEINYIITVVCRYKYFDSNYYKVIAYTPKEIIFPTAKPNQYVMSKIDSYLKTDIYVFKKEETEQYFVIEFNNEVKKEGSYQGKELPITYEIIDPPEFTNATLETEEYFEHGRTVLLLKTDSDYMLFTVGNLLTSSETKYILKYYSIASKSEVYSIDFNNTIEAVRKGDRIYVTFKELFNSPSEIKEITYKGRLFTKESITDEYDLDNIYPNSSLAYKEEEIKDISNKGLTYTHIYSIDSTSTFYANIFAKFTLPDGREESVSYKHTEVVVKPKEIETPKDKVYYKGTLSSEVKSMTYELVGSTVESSIYAIEIVVNNNKLANGFDFSFEKNKITPTLKNETEISFISQKSKSGINTIYLDGKGLSTILFSVFIAETATNDAEVGTLDFNFKYKTIKEVSEDNPKYKIDKFTITSSSSTITVTFNELFKNPKEVESSKYILTLYQQSDITDKKIIDNVNYKESPVDKFFNSTIEGKNNGTSLEHSFDWPKDLSGKLYARIVVYYITKDKEERLDLFEIEEVSKSSSNTLLVIIIVACVVVVLLLLGIFLYIRRRKRLNIDDTKVEVNDAMSMKLM